MPATSKAQQRFFGMVNKYKKEGGSASPAVKKAASGMTSKQVHDFASTKQKGLPDKIGEMIMFKVAELNEASEYENRYCNSDQCGETTKHKRQPDGGLKCTVCGTVRHPTRKLEPIGPKKESIFKADLEFVTSNALLRRLENVLQEVNA